MLEIERQNNESADGRNEAADQDGADGRSVPRRARRAVTRPAGPPAAEAGTSSDSAEHGSGSTHAGSTQAGQAGGDTQAGAAQAGAGRAGGAKGRAARTSSTRASAAKAGEPHADPDTRAGGPATQAGDGGQAGESTQAGGGAQAGGDTGPSSEAAPPKASRSRTSRSRTTKPDHGEQPDLPQAAASEQTAAPQEAAAPERPETSERPGTSQQPAKSERSSAAAQPAVPAAAFQPPLVIFQPPEIAAARPPAAQRQASQQPGSTAGHDEGAEAQEDGRDESTGSAASRRRRRGGRGRGKARDGEAETAETQAQSASAQDAAEADGADTGQPGEDGTEETSSTGKRRRRRRRTASAGDADGQAGDGPADDPPNTVVHVRSPRAVAESDVRAVKGSTRLEAKRQRRREGRESGRRRPPIITESEFLARREAVERVMVVRQHGDRTQIAVLEDGVLVEHYVDKASHQSYVGNVYLGKVQNVLPSMEAAFVDIGKGRNAVLYAGEVNFDASGLEGESKRIESALKSGQAILVQVTKDPIGHKGARLTSQVSLPGRYLVYVPGASMTGISRKLPDTERTRLKQILKQVMPDNAGVIVRTAAEGASEEELSRDVARLSAQWEAIEKKSKTASAPDLLYSEPDLTLRVVRDIFNEDFSNLVIASDSEWDLVDEYVRYVAPHLSDRMQRWDEDKDVFAAYRVDEQLAKALERKVWLPSGGSLVIDHTEAMTVIDVNTGKFTGQGGNLEQTVTRNNLEAAEEIVRQLRLRDLGGIIVIDFIDMVLESNRELVLRRLLECLARDRTKHQVAEVTSLGLVQMTRKRVGSGLLEAFSVPCEHCNGRGVITSLEPVDHTPARGRGDDGHSRDGGRSGPKDQPSSRNGAAPGGSKSGAARGGQAKSDAARDTGPTDSAGSPDESALPTGEAPEPAGTPAGRSRGSRSRSGRASRASGARPEPGAGPAGSSSAAGGTSPGPAAPNGDAGAGRGPAGSVGSGAGNQASAQTSTQAVGGSDRSRSGRGRRSGQESSDGSEEDIFAKSVEAVPVGDSGRSSVSPVRNPEQGDWQDEPANS